MNADTQHGGGTTHTTGASGQDNLVDLVRQLTRQGSHLAEQQLHLLQAEVRESTNELKVAVGAMLGAAVVGVAGLGVLLMAFSYLLGDAIENLGLATLIVGVVTLVVALILYSSARKKMDTAHLSPDRSRRTLERTPDAARGDLTHGA
ncbi:phage holin family protein [Novosphingobium sp. M1R2S20]|uniref:Phage holin family protein n=1 Tax=Novosphingobium rhizovicinum TaxID=3228928 RepID=A0ABV3RGZ4_9SPHN